MRPRYECPVRNSRNGVGVPVKQRHKFVDWGAGFLKLDRGPMGTPHRYRRKLLVRAVFCRGDGAFCVRVRRRSEDGIDEGLAVQGFGQEGLGP
jgi:hypothetical protein